MPVSFLNMAKTAYRMTPFLSIRKVYLWIFSTLVRDKVVQKRMGDINFELDLGETIELALYLEEYEKDLVKSIESFCKPGMVVLDIGANIGAHTLRFGSLVGGNGKVFAFEPTEYAFEKLMRNASLNPNLNISCHRIALSDGNSSEREIDFRSSWRTDNRRKDCRCRASFAKLDDWCREHGVDRVDIIKLDVDGNEFSVIGGAVKVLRSLHPLIFIEVWGPNFSDDARNPFILLGDLGYRFSSLDFTEEYRSVDELRKKVSSKQGELIDCGFNIIAVKHPGMWLIRR